MLTSLALSAVILGAQAAAFPWQSEGSWAQGSWQGASQEPNVNTATSVSAVHAAQATALTESPSSKVSGKAFDRFVVIWLENTDYSKAIGDRKCTVYQMS